MYKIEFSGRITAKKIAVALGVDYYKEENREKLDRIDLPIVQETIKYLSEKYNVNT